jgi:hypothetical protein
LKVQYAPKPVIRLMAHRPSIDIPQWPLVPVANMAEIVVSANAEQRRQTLGEDQRRPAWPNQLATIEIFMIRGGVFLNPENRGPFRALPPAGCAAWSC